MNDDIELPSDYDPEATLIYRLVIIVCLIAAAYFFVTG